MFNSLLNNIKAETDEIKKKQTNYIALHFLLCHTIYTMIKILQTLWTQIILPLEE